MDADAKMLIDYKHDVIKYQKALIIGMEAIRRIDIVFADDEKIIEQAKQKIKSILEGE